MRKSKRNIFLSTCAALLLAGCVDASAKLPNSQEVLMTIGKNNVTKGTIYSQMLNSNGSNIAYNEAKKVIAGLEVEVTDEMKESAESNLETYKTAYGDQFEDYLGTLNLTEEKYLNDYLIANSQVAELTTKYADEKFTELCEQYHPVQSIILTFPSQTDAENALNAIIKDNQEVSVAISENNSTSSETPVVIVNTDATYDSNVSKYILSGTVEDGWTEIKSTDEVTYYLVKILSTNPEDFKDETITALTNTGDLTSDADKFFFEKYKFHIYDISLLNSMKEGYPKLVNQ